MKRLIVPLLLFFCLFLMACPPLAHHYVDAYKIEYSSTGRGGSEYILLKNRALKYVENNQDTIVKPLKKKHFKKLHEYLKNIDLESLSSLKAPSQKYLFDGAQLTTFAITDANPKEHKTLPFDHNNPPEEIKDIILYIKELSKK